jgi:hypothetical protein
VGPTATHRGESMNELSKDGRKLLNMPKKRKRVHTGRSMSMVSRVVSCLLRDHDSETCCHYPSILTFV